MSSGEGSRWCDVCHVALSTDAAAEQHDAGKRHLKLLQVRRSRLQLAARSVFLCGFAARALSQLEIEHYLSTDFGPVSRVILDSAKGTFAIVEFAAEEVAERVRQAKKLQIGAHKVLAKERRIDFGDAADAAVSPLPDARAALAAAFDEIGAADDTDKQVALLTARALLDDDAAAERRAVAERVRDALRPFLADDDLSVRPFGSAVSGLGIVGCDLDMTVLFGDPFNRTGDRMDTGSLLRTRVFLLSTDPAELTGEARISMEELRSLTAADRIRYVSRVLNHARKTDALPITHQSPVFGSRCPTVRFVWAKRLSCDLSVDNRLGLNNTDWLRRLAAADNRFGQLAIVLRCWAAAHDLVGGSPNQLGNYSLTLLLVTILQEKQLLPAVAAGADATVNGEPSVIDGWQCDFNVNAPALPGSTESSVPALLWDILDSIAHRQLKEVVFCPRLGRVMTLADFSAAFSVDADARMTKFRLGALNVADPFVLSHNTAAKVGVAAVKALRREANNAFLRARHADERRVLPALFGVKSVSPRQPPPSPKRKRPPEPAAASSGAPLSDWCADAADSVRRVLVDILLLEPVHADGGSAGSEPTAKRSRVETGARVDYVAPWRSWEGRRAKRRDLVRQNPSMDELAIEYRVSDELRAATARPTEPILQLSVEISPDEAGKTVDVIVTTTKQQNSVDFRNLCHFFDQYLTRFVSPLVRLRF